MNRVQVRRERPTVVAWSIALTVTMLIVYVLTLSAGAPDVAETVSAAPRVTREIRLEQLKCWCVAMGNYPTETEARVAAAGFAARGAAGAVYPWEGAWRVLGTMASSERAAKRMAEKLKNDGAVEAEVIALEAVPVRLRVTAPEMQVEAIAGVDAALRVQIQQLETLPRQLEKGEVEPDGTRTLCALAASEVARAGQRLANIPESSENALCSELIGAADALSGHLQAIADSREADPTALAGMLRQAGVNAFLRLMEFRQGLLAG